MAFVRNRPTASELLSDSQSMIRDNFNTSDDSFGIDHFQFSDATANNGFHKQVTTVYTAGDVHRTTTTFPKFYAMQDSANLGVIQYSRGPSNAIPSPLTVLHSGTAPISLGPLAFTNIFDGTGLTTFFATLYIANISGSTATSLKYATYDVVFINDGSANAPNYRILANSNNSSFFTATTSGSGLILKIQNTDVSTTLSQVFWTFRFHRIIV